VAEELTFGEISTGAHTISNGYRYATSMVKEFGMSERLGYVTFEKENTLFLCSFGGGETTAKTRPADRCRSEEDCG